MRIAVMGSGGVGGYFGGLLARAGHDVTFIARGAHLHAIQQSGLHVESIHGDFTVSPAQATDDPATVGHVDVVLLATKSDQIESAAEATRPMVGPHTTVIPLQNGIDASERTAAVLGAGPVVGGLCYVGSMIAAPGHIRQVSPFRRVIVGELHGHSTPRVEAIVHAICASGAQGESSDDIQKSRWTKFIFIAPFSAVGAVARVPVGQLVGCPETRSLLEGAMREVEAVARSAGVALDVDCVPATLAFCEKMAPGQTASMQRDIMEGRPSELESLVGVMVRLGAKFGVPVPAFQYCYAALLPQERQARHHAQ